MDRVYYAGGWERPGGGETALSYVGLRLTSFDVCKDKIKAIYRRKLHNLACAYFKNGFFHKVVMSTIFHFSIFNIDRVC